MMNSFNHITVTTRKNVILALYYGLLFVKDLENLQFSNSGVKVEILWEYKIGVKIYDVKVEFIKDLKC